MEEQTEQKTTSTAGQGFGITALVLGIIALLTAPIPCVGILALIPGILGIIFAIVALVQASQGHGAKGLIITALVISILGTSISTVWVLFISSPPMMRHTGFRGISRQLKTLQRELEGLEDEWESVPDTSKNYKITIEKTIKITNGDKEEILEQLEGGDTTGVNVTVTVKDSTVKINHK
jgi:hypothetical protein